MGDGEETWTVLPCTWNRECEIDGCKDRHHRLFHEEKVAPRSMEEKADTTVTEKNKSSTCETVQELAQRSIALRTVPVVLKHGRDACKLIVSWTKAVIVSYVNEDVVEEYYWGRMVGRKM